MSERIKKLFIGRIGDAEEISEIDGVGDVEENVDGGIKTSRPLQNI